MNFKKMTKIKSWLGQKFKNLFFTKNKFLKKQHYVEIDFKKEGYPSFISNISGLSIHELWGRWSDSDIIRFEFNYLLPAKFTLILRAKVFGPNVQELVYISIGEQTKSFKLREEMSELRMSFKIREKTNNIRIFPYHPISPKKLKINDDSRNIAIGFESLKINSMASSLLMQFSKEANVLPVNKSLSISSDKRRQENDVPFLIPNARKIYFALSQVNLQNRI